MSRTAIWRMARACCHPTFPLGPPETSTTRYIPRNRPHSATCLAVKTPHQARPLLSRWFHLHRYPLFLYDIVFNLPLFFDTFVFFVYHCSVQPPSPQTSSRSAYGYVRCGCVFLVFPCPSGKSCSPTITAPIMSENTLGISVLTALHYAVSKGDPRHSGLLFHDYRFQFRMCLQSF